MTRSKRYFAAFTCALLFALAACKSSSSSGGGTGGAPASSLGTGGKTVGASGTGAVATAGTSGAAGSAAAANMPDAMCIAGSSHMNPACENCSCTPDASGGCLTEIGACAAAPDAMSSMLCKAIIDCATKSKCTGMACVTPCMAEITAAAGYMSGAPLTAATNVGNCSMMKCSSVCP